MSSSAVNVDLLAFGAHPDDVEIGAGGIIVTHSMHGYVTAICDLTAGELSSNGHVELRRQEASRAGDILGIQHRLCLDFPDRDLMPTLDKILCINQIIRQLKPKIILSPYWQDRHPDHIACGQLVTEAVFDAAIYRKKTPGNESPHRISHLYHYFIHDIHQAHLIVDVSRHYSKKIAAISAYASQFTRKDNAMETPLNQPTYLNAIQGRDQFWGHQIGCGYGEALVSPRPIKQIDLFTSM